MRVKLKERRVKMRWKDGEKKKNVVDKMRRIGYEENILEMEKEKDNNLKRIMIEIGVEELE